MKWACWLLEDGFGVIVYNVTCQFVFDQVSLTFDELAIWKFCNFNRYHIGM